MLTNLVTGADGAVTTNVTSTATLKFTAKGGDGVYTWSLYDQSIGKLNVSGASATYVPIVGVGENVVTVTSGGYTETATVSQY